MNDINNTQLNFEPKSMVGELLTESGRNKVDEYLDELDGPSEDELNNMVAENDLENEELE